MIYEKHDGPHPVNKLYRLRHSFAALVSVGEATAAAADGLQCFWATDGYAMMKCHQDEMPGAVVTFIHWDNYQIV